MPNKNIIIFIAVLVVLVFAGVMFFMTSRPLPQPSVTQPLLEPSPEKKEEIDTSNWKTYHNEKYGFEIKLPPGGKDVSVNLSDPYWQNKKILLSKKWRIELLSSPPDYETVIMDIFIEPRFNFEEFVKNVNKEKTEITGYSMHAEIKKFNDKRVLFKQMCDYGCLHTYSFEVGDEILTITITPFIVSSPPPVKDTPFDPETFTPENFERQILSTLRFIK
jgi:hypothetical protein